MTGDCDVANAELSEDGNVCADGSGPLSRSSVTHVAYIVSKFNDVKKNLVKEIGFGGILELPQITKVDRKFTLWLLTKVDPEKHCIIVNDQCIADVIDFEVARIMGIPCGTREVCSLDSTDKKSKVEFVQQFIGSSDLEINSLTAAENNVKAEYDSPMSMTLKEKHNFKVSFVVWVMGHLLAPTKKHNVGGDRFWGALLDPDEINQFNWCQYVIGELMTAARDVQNALKQKKPISTITGCSILLQILYFESINMGTLNRPGGISPRVKVYDAKSLSMMIAADKASCATGSPNPTWGSTVRLLPEVRSESFHFASRTCIDATNTNIPKEDQIINHFGTYIREKFGEKVSLAQSVALSWFHARCTHHYQQMRLSIQQDTIDLVGKLFGSPDVSMPTLPSKTIPSTGKARQAQSEPSRPPTYGKTLQKNKREDQFSATCYKRRATKKHHVSFREHALPETLLSGMSVSDEHEVGDELSDNGSLSRTTSHNSGCNIEVPSFDLGIELNTNGNEDHLPAINNYLIRSPVLHESSDVRGNPNLSVGFPEPSPTPKITLVSMVSINDSSNNSMSTADDKHGGSLTPMSWLDALCGTPPSVKSIKPPIFTSPDQRIKSFTTSPGTLSKILAEGDLVERITRSEDSPNINIKPWDDDYLDSPIKKQTIDSPKMAKSPWTCNLYHRNPPKDIVDKFFHDVSLSSFSLLNRPWLAHTCPRHIELDGTWIHKSFITQTGLSYDVCDLAIRRIKQLDDMLYSEKTNSHWRHILESEFAMLALAGEVAYNRKSIVEQFIGSSLGYRLENCRMIVVPAYILLNWSCYLFDFEERCVHVIDPLYSKDQSDVFTKMHYPNVSKVAASLATCFEIFFENWHPNMQDWDIKFVQPSILDATSAETGLLTLMYIRDFDGSNTHFGNRDSFHNFKKVMLYELMCLSENPVKPPISLTITVDD